MERNDIVVLENLQQEDDQPRYLVVLAKEIENYAADGSSFDYSLENGESGCENDMMKAIEAKLFQFHKGTIKTRHYLYNV